MQYLPKTILGDSGFHLIDLVLTLALFGLMLSLSAPSLTGFRHSQILRRESQSLERTIRESLLLAAQTETKITLTFSENSYQREKPFVLRHTLAPQIKIDRADEIGELVFYSGGSTSPRTIRLRQKDSICSIKISLRGRIRSSC